MADGSPGDGRSVAALAAGIRPHRPNGEETGQHAEGATARPPTDLTIDAVELDFLDQLADLLDGNPRALKRFVNTYRLVKSSLSDIELEVFRSRLTMLGRDPGGAQYLPYRVCMAQLAVLCTQRERALRMVRVADDHPASLGAWFERLSQDDPELAVVFNSIFDHPGPQTSFDTFAFWLERTRRYSFYL